AIVQVLSAPTPFVQLPPLTNPHFAGSVVQPSQLSRQPKYTEQSASSARWVGPSIGAHVTSSWFVSTFVANCPAAHSLAGALSGAPSPDGPSGTPGRAFAHAPTVSATIAERRRSIRSGYHLSHRRWTARNVTG